MLLDFLTSNYYMCSIRVLDVVSVDVGAQDPSSSDLLSEFCHRSLVQQKATFMNPAGRGMPLLGYRVRGVDAHRATDSSV